MSKELIAWRIGVLASTTCSLLIATSAAIAQFSNASYTIPQDTVSSGGGQVGSSSAINAKTVLGLPASGIASNATYTIIGGFGPRYAPYTPLPTTTITVSGTIDDPTATVTVNGVPATISGTTFTAGVPLLLGKNTITATATDPAGNSASRSIAVYLDLPTAKKTARFTSNVHLTVDDPGATVSVNGISATRTATDLVAAVPLTSGLNTLTATATDAAGNTGTASVRVFVPLLTEIPPMPTVGKIGDVVGNITPTVTTQSSITIGGTKVASTTIWINGSQIPGDATSTTWTGIITLTEGDNDLSIVAKNALGISSAEATINVIVDNLPPVITVTDPAKPKTNFNPVLLKGTVDDSLTTVTVHTALDPQERLATRSRRKFEVSVPLVLGPNTLTITATSPNKYVSTMTLPLTLGTIPRIQTWQPLDATKLYLGTTAALQVSAIDAENDPIQYQALVDSAPLADWGNGVPPWTPSSSQLGLHTISVKAQDGYGGDDTKNSDVFVLRQPIKHP